MSTIFPLSASVNQIFQGYRYNGEKWELIGIDLTADYPEIVDGKISASVIPDTFATIAYVDQEVGNVDLSPYLTVSNASVTYATKTELDNIDLSSASAAAVAAIVDSAPATLDTLNELAQALNDDENFATTVTTSLAGKLDISSASNTYLTQIGASGLYLTQINASTTYATKTEVENLDLLPSQTGNDGKYLSTDGSAAYWEVLDIPPSALYQTDAPVDAEIGTIWVDSNASAAIINTNDFVLKSEVEYYSPHGFLTMGA